MNDITMPKSGPFTGRHLLLIVMAAFAVIIGVNMTMVLLAARSFPGMVVENSYVASQRYNELIEAGRRQADWTVEWSSDRGILRLKLAPPRGMSPTGLSVTALAGRPSTDALDRRLSFAGAEAGSYVANEALPPGLWEVDVEVRRGGELVFRQTEELTVLGPGR